MHRKPGRPRGLTVEAIAQAALDDGLSAFSMPSVARRLGVAHSGLYRYVTDRDELLVAALELAVADVIWPAADLPWQDLLRAIGATAWELCEVHPGFDRAELSAPQPPPSAAKHVEEYVVSIQKQGFPIEDAAVSVELVLTLALTSSAELQRLQTNGAEVASGHGSYDRKLEIVLAGLARRQVA